MKPNILFVLVDNLGYGELGCYGGGELRGAATPRADHLATEGLRLTNFNVEAQCTPSRSAIMTGRYAARSGTLSVPVGENATNPATHGLAQWEVTIAKLLSTEGYRTAHFGKWHLGSVDGRFPNDQGFDEWYGIPRTTDEVFWPEHPGAAHTEFDQQYIMEGKRGEKSARIKPYDLTERPLLDTEIVRRSKNFMRECVEEERPFYLYVPLTQVHFPSIPHPDFAGKTGNGDFADSVVEMDHHLGDLLDTIDELGVKDETIVVFTSDNGPEPTWPWQGSAGPWRGYYFTHMEGSLRVPFIIRWPGKVPAGAVSNEMVHEVDMFNTLASIAGASLPVDRPIDGVDQSRFFFGESKQSARDTVLAFVGERLEAVKWRDWKVSFYEAALDWFDPPQKLLVPKVFNLLMDPKEEHPDTMRNTLVLAVCTKAVAAFNHSMRLYRPVPEGALDPYIPEWTYPSE